MPKLRRMQAEYFDMYDIKVQVGNEIVEIPHAIAFKSYYSVCAIFNPETKVIYMLPRWDYSVTTLRQLRAFVEDVTEGSQFDIKELRKYGKHITSDNIFAVSPGYYFKYSTKIQRC